MPKAKTAAELKKEALLYDPKRFVTLSKVQEFPRIPTGIAAIDIYTCGGIPHGTNTLVSGPAGTGKTNSAIKMIVGYQRLYPKDKVLYCNSNNKMDKEWAEILGTNNDMIEEYRPDSAEDA